MSVAMKDAARDNLLLTVSRRRPLARRCRLISVSCAASIASGAEDDAGNMPEPAARAGGAPAPLAILNSAAIAVAALPVRSAVFMSSPSQLRCVSHTFATNRVRHHRPLTYRASHVFGGHGSAPAEPSRTPQHLRTPDRNPLPRRRERASINAGDSRRRYQTIGDYHLRP